VVVVVLLAVVVGIVLWRISVARKGAANSRSRRRFVAPDDDPEFLRWLDRRTRRRDDE
jgi:hypothetical protein